jgi:hypothetical protein
MGCGVTSAYASAEDVPPGLPAGIFTQAKGGEENNGEKPQQAVQAQGEKAADAKENVKLYVDPMRERIKAYLKREVKERKAIVEKDIEEHKNAKKNDNEPVTKVAREQSGGEMPVAKQQATGKAGEEPGVIQLEPSMVVKTYKIPEGSVQAKADQNGVYHIDGLSGKTHVVEISRSLFNKIKTPFKNPKILTTSSLLTKVKDSDIFVATGSDRVTGIWVYDEDNPLVSVSIALLPRPTSPVTMQIDVPEESLVDTSRVPLPPTSEIRAVDIPYEAKLSQGTPFDKAVVDLVSKIVSDREYPEGYGVINYNRTEPGMVCQHPDIQGKLKQTLKGEMFDIDIISIKNFSKYPARVEEPKCYSKGVVAVSVNPAEYLKSGEVGELVVVKMAKDYVQKHTPKKDLRPAIDAGEW